VAEKVLLKESYSCTDCLNSKSRAENVLAEFTSHFKEVSKPNTVGADEAYTAKITEYLSSHGDILPIKYRSLMFYLY